MRNNIKKYPSKELFSDRTNTSPNDSAFVIENCKLKISDQKTKKHAQIDMQ